MYYIKIMESPHSNSSNSSKCRELFNMYCSCLYIKDIDKSFNCIYIKKKLEKCIKKENSINNY